MSSQEVKFSGAFWSIVVDYLKDAGVPAEQTGQAITIITTLASAALGRPLLTQLRARRSETLSQLITTCLKVIPAEWYIDSLEMPKLDREILNGKIVVSTTDSGLPLKTTATLHQYFLREDPKTGYIGALHEKDPLQEQSSVLVIDLEKDTSKIVERFRGQVLDCTPDVKAILLEAHLKLLRLYNPDFDVNFLATALTIKTPEKIPILRVAEVIGKMSAVPFQSSDISPIGVTDNFSPKEAYGLSREILKDSVKVSKPLNLEISDNELIVYKALKRLTKSGVKNRNGQAIFEKLEDMKASISRATVYRALDSLVKQGILQKLKDSSYERMEGEIGYDQFPRLKLPTVEELFPVGNSVAQDPMNPSDANHPVSCEVEGGGEPPQSGEVIQENLQP